MSYIVQWGVRGGEAHEHVSWTFPSKRQAIRFANVLTGLTCDNQNIFREVRNCPRACWESSTHYVNYEPKE